MKRLTDQDIATVLGTRNAGYTIEQAKLADFDKHYGFVLAMNSNGHFVTWQFHLLNEKPEYYWGHYFQGNKTGAIEDFKMRD